MSLQITPAELEIMKVLWKQPGIGASEIVDALDGEQDWSPRTVKTLLSRLVKKGALGFEAEGKRYLYHALLSREACVQAESDSFIERVCGGAVSPLLASFVRTGKLGSDEISELKRLLEDQEAKSDE